MNPKTSAHEKYRQELRRVTSGDWVVDALSAAFPDVEQQNWVQTFARFSPDEEPWAEFVFEHVGESVAAAHVRIFSTKEMNRCPFTHVMHGIGSVGVTPASMDERLPGLSRVLETPGSRILRYRPGKRCTVKCTVDGTSEPLVAKVFPDDRGESIDAEGRLLFAAASAGALGFRMAKPLRWQPRTHTLWQETLPGFSVENRLGTREGPGLAESMGYAAGTIPECGVVASKVLDWQTQFKRTERAANQIAHRIPRLASKLRGLMGELKKVHERRTDVRLRSVHGAPHAGQWLLANDGTLGLVDFDRFCRAEPELDCATFLGELDYETMSASRREAVAKSFVTGYERAAGPLDVTLLEAYRIHKHISRVLRVARAVRTDGNVRAGEILEQICVRMDQVAS